jgi:MFS family permease
MLSGRFLRALDARNTVRVGSALIFAGALGLALMPSGSGAIATGAGSFVIGFGMGLLNTTFIILIQGSVTWAQRGSATASNIFARMLGSTFGAAILGAVLNGSLNGVLATSSAGATGIDTVRRMFDDSSGFTLPAAQREALVDALGYGLTHVFATLAVFGLLTMLATWFVPRRAAFASAKESAPAGSTRTSR